MPAQILVVEDDIDINRVVTMNLNDAHYRVDSAHCGKKALQMVRKKSFDLIVLDRMLPEVDGLDICRQLREDKNFTPILMLTARDSEADRIVGLEMGADDYLTKPFSIGELQARIKALLRRANTFSSNPVSTEEVIEFGAMQIYPLSRTVKVSSQDIELTSKEFDLLLYMARHPGQVFSRTQLLDEVWNYQFSGYEHTVNSHINRLRAKIESTPTKPEYVQTVWGVGYRFQQPNP